MNTDARGCLSVRLQGNERRPNKVLELTASSVRSCVAVRRESGMEECGNTFGYTGTR